VVEVDEGFEGGEVVWVEGGAEDGVEQLDAELPTLAELVISVHQVADEEQKRAGQQPNLRSLLASQAGGFFHQVLELDGRGAI
jgi:hypothetical protein